MHGMQFIQPSSSVKSILFSRPLFPGDMFGVNPADEVEGLLFMYCKHQAEAKPGEWAMTMLVK